MIPWRRETLPTPVFWPGEFHGLYSPWGCKESDTTEQLSLHFSSLGSSNITDSSVKVQLYLPIYHHILFRLQIFYFFSDDANFRNKLNMNSTNFINIISILYTDKFMHSICLKNLDILRNIVCIFLKALSVMWKILNIWVFSLHNNFCYWLRQPTN